MQGVTAKPGTVAYWQFRKVLPNEIKWLVVYVMLSRVPSLSQMQSVALTTRVRRNMEAGAPENLVQTFQRLFRNNGGDAPRSARCARAVSLGPCPLDICVLSAALHSLHVPPPSRCRTLAGGVLA